MTATTAGRPLLGVAALAVVLARLVDDHATEEQAVLLAIMGGHTVAELYAEANVTLAAMAEDWQK